MQQISYYEQPIGKIWSGEHYDDTYRGVTWPWYNLPFADDYMIRRNRNVAPPSRFIKARSIIEIGSAMGQGYATLLASRLVDLSGYVGYDVSEIGQALCRQRYPNATWVEGDFTRMTLDRRFEYAYERHSFHHMPQPLEQIAKVLSCTDRAACFTFRGRVRGETVSDLDRARFNHYEKSGYAGDGYVFMNLLNVLDVARIARDCGFNHLGVRVGLHEQVQGVDPNRPGYWLDPAVTKSGGRLLRFVLFMAKVPELNKPLLYAFAGQRRVYLEPDFYRLGPALSRLA